MIPSSLAVRSYTIPRGHATTTTKQPSARPFFVTGRIRASSLRFEPTEDQSGDARKEAFTRIVKAALDKAPDAIKAVADLLT